MPEFDCGSVTVTGRSNGSAAGDEFMSVFARVCEEHRQRKTEWIEQLRADGVKAARPDDGWVDREADIVTGPDCYPDFNDGVEVGDLIALGDPKKYRLCRITDIRLRWPEMSDRIEWAYERV
jgi:hypothetical protein